MAINLCVIPARGGSKRIPGKNIREFCGRPIIAYSIEAALSSDVFHRIIVSTDDAEIAAVAQQFGAEVPFMRPTAFSGDHAPTFDVIQHAIRYFSDAGEAPSFVCCVYPTAPFLTSNVLRSSLAQLTADPSKEFCFGVTEYDYPIQRALRITEETGVSMFQPEYFLARSQDLEQAYHDAAQFYWGRADAFLNSQSVISPQSIPFILPIDHVQDIDTPDDWRRAEAMFRALKKDAAP